MNLHQSTIPRNVRKQLEQNSQNRQLEIDASKVQLESTAEHVAKHLYDEIITYQNKLSDQEDVIMILVQFGQSVTIRVTQIGYIGYNLICFHGEDMYGKPLELIQHIQQLNFLLSVAQKPEVEISKRQIGFVGQID